MPEFNRVMAIDKEKYNSFLIKTTHLELFFNCSYRDKIYFHTMKSAGIRFSLTREIPT